MYQDKLGNIVYYKQDGATTYYWQASIKATEEYIATLIAQPLDISVADPSILRAIASSSFDELLKPDLGSLPNTKGSVIGQAVQGKDGEWVWSSIAPINFASAPSASVAAGVADKAVSKYMQDHGYTWADLSTDKAKWDAVVAVWHNVYDPLPEADKKANPNTAPGMSPGEIKLRAEADKYILTVAQPNWSDADWHREYQKFLDEHWNEYVVNPEKDIDFRVEVPNVGGAWVWANVPPEAGSWQHFDAWHASGGEGKDHWENGAPASDGWVPDVYRWVWKPYNAGWVWHPYFSSLDPTKAYLSGKYPHIDEYAVQSTDTIATIAKANHTTADDILAVNPVLKITPLKVGQVINIPVSGKGAAADPSYGGSSYWLPINQLPQDVKFYAQQGTVKYYTKQTDTGVVIFRQEGNFTSVWLIGRMQFDNYKAVLNSTDSGSWLVMPLGMPVPENATLLRDNIYIYQDNAGHLVYYKQEGDRTFSWQASIKATEEYIAALSGKSPDVSTLTPIDPHIK